MRPVRSRDPPSLSEVASHLSREVSSTLRSGSKIAAAQIAATRADEVLDQIARAVESESIFEGLPLTRTSVTCLE